jgi:arabinofuranosyltransferase
MVVSKPTTSPVERWAELVGLTFLLGGLLIHSAWFGHVCDDAYISFRYAYNLAHGAGLVFNPGERVMGYSNLLWVLLLAGFEWVGISSVAAATLLGSLCSLLLLALLFLHLRRACRSRWPAFAALLFLVSNSTFALWTTAGLEGPLFALLLTAGVLAAVHAPAGATPARALATGLPFALAVLTRPEGSMFAVVAALAIVAWHRNRGAWRAAGLLLIAPLLAWGAQSLWMFAYYGDFLPNTYYAKTLPLSLPVVARGARLAWRFLATYRFLPLVVVVTWLALGHRAYRLAGWLALVLIAAFVVFYLAVGGDELVYYRMWFWTLPLFAILLAESLDALMTAAGRVGRLAAWALALGAAGVSLYPSFAGSDWRYLRNDDTVIKNIDLITEWLRHLPGDTVLAANTVGVLTYGSRLHMVDMLGLNDRHIARAPGKSIGVPAHESHDGAYVLDRHPDLVFLGMPRLFVRPLSLGQEVRTAGYPSDLDLLRDRRFREDYQAVNVRVSDGRFCPVFARRTSLERLGLEAPPRPTPKSSVTR